MYWVGQKFWPMSVTSYEKARVSILANPVIPVLQALVR